MTNYYRSHPHDTNIAYSYLPDNNYHDDESYEYRMSVVPRPSSLSPRSDKDERGIFIRAFGLTHQLLDWLQELEFKKISKISERDIVAEQLQGILHIAKEAFDIAHGQAAGNTAPDRTPRQVDSTGRTIIVLYDPVINHYYKQMQSLFLSSASGKQAPSSGQTSKEGIAHTSMGDVQVLPNDSIRAFQKAIPALRNAILEGPRQKDINYRFGYVQGSRAIQGTDDLRVDSSRHSGKGSQITPDGIRTIPSGSNNKSISGTRTEIDYDSTGFSE